MAQIVAWITRGGAALMNSPKVAAFVRWVMQNGGTVVKYGTFAAALDAAFGTDEAAKAEVLAASGISGDTPLADARPDRGWLDTADRWLFDLVPDGAKSWWYGDAQPETIAEGSSCPTVRTVDETLADIDTVAAVLGGISRRSAVRLVRALADLKQPNEEALALIERIG